jgi:hypothetical protein
VSTTIHLPLGEPAQRPARHRSTANTVGRIASLAALAAVVAVTSVYAASGADATHDDASLGTAGSFAVLAGSGITNTGPTTITGDVGSFPTPAQTGFDSVVLIGENHHDDAVTQGAKDDLTTAYDVAAGLTGTAHQTELGGSTLLAGVYTSPTFGLTGTLTLDAQNVADAEFVFQVGSDITTASNSQVLLINGANPCHVVWQVGASATFGTGTAFVGDVLAHTSITANTGATFRGRLLAMGGAVTLDTNIIDNDTCATTGDGSTTSSSTTSSSTTSSSTTTTAPAGTTTTTAPAGTTTTEAPAAATTTTTEAAAATTTEAPTVPTTTPAAGQGTNTGGAPVTPTGSGTGSTPIGEPGNPAGTPAGGTPTGAPGIPTATPGTPGTPTGTAGPGTPSGSPDTPRIASPGAPSSNPLPVTGMPFTSLLAASLALLAGGVGTLAIRSRTRTREGR